MTLKPTLGRVSAVVIPIGAVLALIVSWQTIEKPYAPRELVIVVAGNTTRIAEWQMESLNAQLLANQIKQSDLRRKGERVDDAYRQQERDFKRRIQKLERELEGPKK